MTTTTQTPTSVSHYIELGRFGHVNKESVNLTFATTWRGKDAVVRMEASRYRFGEHPLEGGGQMSEWRVYADKAVGGTDVYAYGADLTGTARSRLSDAHRDAVNAFLASDEYRASYQRAIASAVKGALTQSRYDTRDAKAALDANATDLNPIVRAQLRKAIDAFDAYQDALAEVAP